MNFSGKRLDRIRLPKQLRYPTDLAWQIRAMAQMGNRSYESQILHLVQQGIRYEELGKREEVINGHNESQGVIRFGR